MRRRSEALTPGDSAHRRRSAVIPAAVGRTGDDPAFALSAEAAARARAGEPIVDATLGTLVTDAGELAILPTVAEAMGRIAPERSAAYAPIAGGDAFLHAVVSDVFGDGAPATRAVAVATPGATGAIHHAFMNFLEPGQAALVPNWHWGPYQVIAAHVGRGLRSFRLLGPELRFDLDSFRAGLRRLIRDQGRALVVLNFPANNPTGYSLNGTEWSGLAEVVRAEGRDAPVAVLIDDAYAKFHLGATRWVEYLPAMLDTATVLVAWTASKSYTLYGARVGALVGVHRDPMEQDRIANALGYSCRATWNNCNHFGILATTELLTDPDLRERTDAERRRLIELLRRRMTVFDRHARAAGLSYPRYEGGFFVSVLTPDGERTAAAMRRAGVYVVPLRGAVRIAMCAVAEADIPRMVDALTRGVAAAG